MQRKVALHIASVWNRNELKPTLFLKLIGNRGLIMVMRILETELPRGVEGWHEARLNGVSNYSFVASCKTSANNAHSRSR